MAQILQKKIKPGKPISVTSHSPEAPFSVVFEDDGNHAYFFAVTKASSGNPNVEDAVCIYTVKTLPSPAGVQTMTIAWSHSGEDAALLIDGTFHAIFKFVEKKGLARKIDDSPEKHWKRIRLEWDPAFHQQFPKEIFLTENKSVKQAMAKVIESKTPSNRIALFKALIKTQVVVPVSGPDSDPSQEFLVFPYQAQNSVLCAFTDTASFTENLGTQVHSKNVSVDSLFKLLRTQPISAVLLTGENQKSVVIDKDEFPLLSIGKEAQSLSYAELLKSMGKSLLKPLTRADNHPIFSHLNEALSKAGNIQSAYLFRSNAKKSGPIILGVLLIKKDNRKMVHIYQKLLALMKQFPDAPEIELNELRQGEYLTGALRETIPPFFKAPQKKAKKIS